MDTKFDENIFYGHLIKGELNSALRYLRQFPEQAGLYGRYRSLFEQGHFVTCDTDSHLNELLAVYQQYYREVFYLKNAEEAVGRMRNRFAVLLDADQDMAYNEMEDRLIAEAFRSRSYHFLA